jgi:preprotein translocase subunit SecD
VTIHTEDDLRAALSRDADAGGPAVEVWSRLHRRIVVRRRVRAGVAVTALAAAASVLAVVLPSGDSTARLPIARSGTTTLVPEHHLSDPELATSVDILRQRIDALGISGATIATHDGRLDLEARGLSPAEIDAIATPGVLQFRPVKGIAAPTSCPTPSTSVPAADGEVSCSLDGNVQYTLGPAALGNADVKSAAAVANTIDNSWLVQLDFSRAGAQKFFLLTADAASKPALSGGGSCEPPKGCNAIAIVVDGAVVSAPSVEGSGGIRGGQTQITGEMTRQQARTLAAIVVTQPLPAGFTIG